MQGSISSVEWVPPGGTLGALTRAAHVRADAVAPLLAALRAQASDTPRGPGFAVELRGSTVRVIGEVKRSSPSKGAIAPGIDAALQARRYVEGGAAAISVLTEPAQFGGSLEDLSAVAAAVSVPVLRKDFLVHPVQVWEARVRSASAVLLIVRALDQDRLSLMLETVREAGLEALVEVRTERELERALSLDAKVIGVNNRDLETLVIDVDNAPRLVRLIPTDRIAVAESGMRDAQDVARVARAGADAVLVGSAISASGNPEAAVRTLASVPSVLHARR